MLQGYILAVNGRENTACYKAGVDSTTGLESGPILCPNDGGELLSVDWGLPCSENGVAVTGFDYQKATNSTKPRADAVKVITVLDTRNGGNYKRFLVVDTFTVGDYISLCCAGCAPVAAVTIPEPIIMNGECVLTPPVIPPCTYKGSLVLPTLVGSLYTVTAYGYTAAGVPIVFAPATSTGATAAAVATSMTTNWAAETGSGTFVATGQVINWTSLNGSKIGFTVTMA